MTDATLEALIRRAFESRASEVFFVFQGGEPTLAGLDFFERAASLQKQLCKGRRYHNSLQTNGTLLDGRWCSFLKREDYLVGLSLDGEAAAHDAYLPGFKKEDVTLELENGYMTVTASKGVDKDEKTEKGKLIRQERYAGALQRSFYVGEALTREDISAKLEHGVLSINVPKKEARKLPEKQTIMIEG